MKYELLIVIPAQYSETELPGIFEALIKHVAASGAQVTGSSDLGKQKLAYQIGQARFGHMLLVKLEAEKAVAKTLNEQMRLRGEVIRHMLTEVIRHMLTKVEERAPVKPRRVPELIKREPVFATVASSNSPSVKKEDKLTLEDLDRKLDEILGKETI